MPKLAIIHTTPVTVDSLKTLAAEVIGDVQVINFVDDSILPELSANGGQVEDVAERWLHYARFAEQAGADVILSACSSVGELAARAAKSSKAPVLRIDEAMAEEAVSRGTRVGVAATLPTTLAPTTALIKAKGEEAGKPVVLVPVVAETAYRKLMEGDKEGHDEELAAVLAKLAADTDVVVLAQASMARVLSKLPEKDRSRFLSSPRSGMERVKQVLEKTVR
ncbi:aspartate/glutamate racemase family protein [Paenibacillus aurantius]|uniref:Aspartate/glutamate racemase family protein n=1 Tax=Paenibacillus aurantius TaxID=2918900 RepID=A0AA96RFL1_9BACL|nr:aspartate/glutamate racemase family protein [Paenibacillus aurantius]WNQ09104.1 aspartate/glutamate racemase family protein [Paenibacillus aurantius]